MRAKIYRNFGKLRVLKRRAYAYSSLVALVVLLSTACSKRYQDLPVFSGIPFRDSQNYSVGRFKTSYLADQIHAYFRGSIAGPIAVTTFVDIDNLYQSSTFGRILSEQLISELSMRGYNVVEVRLSDAMQIMQNEGEFGLSRETNVLRPHQNLSALVVGTYASSPVRVYLNTRVIDPSSAAVLSVGSVEMQKTSEISRLIRTNSLPSTLERIPVRHLGYSVYPSPYYWPQYGYGSPVPPPSYLFGDDLGSYKVPSLAPEKTEEPIEQKSPPKPTLGSLSK